ncbi:MAG: ferredoxin family protein [Deltaproteobacteria bacterium]|nr:ferredoxin family protein [Deltaproteobacteria bacterium]
MPYVVIDNCNGCRFTDCVEVCPVDCFHGDEKMLYIDPTECIDCGACEPECPVQAILEESELPSDQQEWIQINADKAPDLPVITEKVDPLPGADERKAALGF